MSPVTLLTNRESPVNDLVPDGVTTANIRVAG
jgi:hypothetical protein